MEEFVDTLGVEHAEGKSFQFGNGQIGQPLVQRSGQWAEAFGD
jgi:hypothetical protein